MKRKRLILIAMIVISLSILLFLGICSGVFAKEPMEFITGTSPGGGSDIAARTIAIPLRKILEEDIIVYNMPGAGATVCMDYVTKQPADGRTFALFSDFWALSWANQVSKHGIDDFKAVIRLQSDPRFFVIRTDDERFKSWEEVIEYAKKNPEKTVTVGGAGPLSIDAIVVKNANQTMGLDMNYIPLGSTGKAITALLGGHVDIATGSVQSFVGQLEAGSVKIVLSLTKERLEPFPKVPTAVELGYNVLATLQRGIVVRSETPSEKIKELHDAFKEAMKSTVYKNYIKASYLDIEPGYLNSEAFQKSIQDLYDDYSELIKEE